MAATADAPDTGQVAEVVLSDVPRDKVPAQLRPDYYFDFEANPYEHSSLLTDAHDVIEVLGWIQGYVVKWLEDKLQPATSLRTVTDGLAPGTKVVGKAPLARVEQSAIFAPDSVLGSMGDAASSEYGVHVSQGAHVLGGVLDLRAGSIWIGAAAVVEPGAYISGPCIIGRETTLRSGAYIRGSVIVGDGAVLRGELKNSLIMNKAELAHPGYCGDSIIGYKGHFGCQALTANLGLFGSELTVRIDSTDAASRYRLGRKKIGLILGDGSQLGCNSVSDPGTFVAPRTHVYPLSRLASGFYGPDVIIKNKPAEAGVLVTQPLTR